MLRKKTQRSYILSYIAISSLLISATIYAATTTPSKRLVVLQCSAGGKTNFTQKLVTTGQSVTLRITPITTSSKTHTITKVTRDTVDITNQIAIASSGVGTYTFTPTETRTKFFATLTEVNLYKITATPDPHGIIKYPTKPIATGSKATVTITPSKSPHYLISSVTANETDVTSNVTINNSGNGTYTFTMGAADVTIAVTYIKINLMKVTATATTGEGRVFPASWSIGHDKSRNFTCYPAAGYIFDGATLDGVALSAILCKRNTVGNTNCKVINISDVASEATFACLFRTCDPTRGDCSFAECKLRSQTCKDYALADCDPLVGGSCSQTKCKNLPRCQLKRLWWYYGWWHTETCPTELYYDQIKVPSYPGSTDYRQTCAPFGFWCNTGNHYWQSAIQQGTGLVCE